MPKLIVLTEGIEPTSFDLTKEVTSVGRVDDNDITLPHPSVSGSHAELVLRRAPTPLSSHRSKQLLEPPRASLTASRSTAE